MTPLPTLLLLAAAAFAGGPRRAVELPRLPEALAAAASPTIAVPADGFWSSQDAARNERLRQLADAGARDFFAEKGLLLWQLTPYQARGRERLQLTFSLFDGAAPSADLAAALDEHGEAVRGFAAAATGVHPDDVLVSGDPMKSCCGGGCAACLHSKKGPSRYWTRVPRAKR